MSNMTDFCSGSIPLVYRQIYDICSHNGEPILKEVYQLLLSKCNLNPTQLKIIWDMVGPQQGVVNRTNFYKSLALIAWAQQGKQLNEKLFDNCANAEYPSPDISDLNTVKNLKIKLNYTHKIDAGFNYASIVQMDTISVELVPEKKGLFIKYSEYIVSSKRFNSRVTRRYNDFVAVQELLINRFPYRLVPSLPPKKIVSDAHFLESRRRGLHRWLTLVCRHPTISQDSLVSFFLTDQGPDFQYRVREIFRRAPDEFMTSDIAANSKDLLPSDSGQIATSREQIRSLVHVIGRLKVLTEASIERKLNSARDSDELSNQLKSLGSIQIGQNRVVDNWGTIQRSLVNVSREIQPLSSAILKQVDSEQTKVCERLGLLFDILISHKELCERLEKGLAHDHQSALSKMLSLKKRKIQGVIRGSDAESVERLEAKMLAQENVITNMELRSDFSLYCVHMETQLVFAYLETLSSILNNLVSLEIKSHSELQNIWGRVLPVAQECLAQQPHFSNGVSEVL